MTTSQVLDRSIGLYISGYTLALDMTARNIQEEAKKKQHPWTVAKVSFKTLSLCHYRSKNVLIEQGYDTFCPVSAFISKADFDIHAPTSGRCSLQFSLTPVSG